MPIPSTPQELARRIASLDQEAMTLIREIEQRRARGEPTGDLEDVLERVRSERVHLQFFVASEVPTGLPSFREPPARAVAAVDPSLRIGRASQGARRWLVVGLAVGAGVVGWLLVRGGESPPVTTRVEQLPAEPERPAIAVTAVAPQRPAAATLTDGGDADAGAGETVEWQATVKAAPPGTVTVGTSCKLVASLRAGPAGEAGDGVVARLGPTTAVRVWPVVECGDRRLYDGFAISAATRSARAGRAFLFERPGTAVGQYELWLQYEDVGERAEPFEAWIDTPGGRIVVWTTGPAPGRIELTVGQWASRTGRALNVGASPASVGFLEVDRMGKVVGRSGLTTATEGQRCSFRLVPNSSSRLTCRANLTCGDTVVYGAGTTGYLECSFVDGLPTVALDGEADDGDPIFAMDLPAGRVTARSDQPGELFSVTVALDPPTIPQ